jgi:hypothetical protein
MMFTKLFEGRYLRVLALTALGSLFAAPWAVAAPVPVTNPGFEANVLPDGWTSPTIVGWTTSSGGGDGAYNPTSSDYPSGIPEGQNVAYSNGTGNQIRQTLSTTLQANKAYVLTMQVGKRANTPFAGYRVQLRAGGVVLAEDNSSQTPPSGGFVTSRVSFRAPAGHAQLGQNLEIRMWATGVQANFDDVKLEAFPAPDMGKSCWEILGWSSTNYVGAQAILDYADCTTIPDGYGWIQGDLWYGTPPTDELWYRIRLDDSRVTGWIFEPLLVFSHYDAGGKPVVLTDLIVCGGCINEMPILPYPPKQGIPQVGSRVRIRHKNTNHCLYTNTWSGGHGYNRTCSDDDDLTFVLDDAGSGYFRLRQEISSQCVYTESWNNGPVRNWGCWNDPGFRFQLISQGGGYRLRNVSQNQCPYGNSTNYGQVLTWGCWSDPAMVFYLDIQEY